MSCAERRFPALSEIFSSAFTSGSSLSSYLDFVFRGFAMKF